MTEETPKKIDWKEIIATSKISILWYIVISFIWWIMGIYPHILFSLGGQLTAKRKQNVGIDSHNPPNKRNNDVP
jgi:hypothetical protein